MYSNFKEKGIEYAKKAVEEDQNNNHEEALKYYRSALDYFSTHLKYEKNEKQKEIITAKFKEYLDRAEYLKKVVDGETQGGGATAGGGATGQKTKPKGTSNEEEKEKLKGQLGSVIQSEKPNIKWDDVAGLEHAKEALKEAVILPVKFPQFFVGKRRPWTGILLYGPPGTGKSYLAKAVATEANSTYFSVSSADLVSKWMGESEKLVAELFRMAKEAQPSIVFIDEVDSLCSMRGENESEAARRIKTQFLVEMNDIRDNQNSLSRVLVLGATNMPYQLDQAIRRRFDKRIYIPLPDPSARAVMFRIHLGSTPHNLTDQDFLSLAKRTEGFSGSDINVLVRDVIMEPLRKIKDATHFRQTQSANGEVWEPCAPSSRGAMERDLDWFADNGLSDKVKLPDLIQNDFEKVLLRARPTVSKDDLDTFTKFTSEFGEEGS